LRRRQDTRDDPAVFQRPIAARPSIPQGEREAALAVADALDDEASGVPDLVRKVAALLQLLVVETEVVAGAAAGRQREPQGINPVLVRNLERVNHIAKALGHFAALGVAD
jgi:hypothetical protein